MTNLTNALKECGINKLTFHSDCLDYTVDLPVVGLPDSSILTLLNYGTRKINDQFNSGKTKHGQTVDYFETLLDAVRNGTMQAGNTRASVLGTDDKGIRDLILDWMKNKCRIPASRLKEVKGLKPAALIDEIFSDKPEEWRDDVLGRFVTKWERIKAIAFDEDNEIEIA